MNIFENMRIALGSLSANKLRSGLTMLGIIIGVMSVIAMLSIGEGAQAAITAQINAIGTNLLFIRPGAVQQGGVASAAGSAATLTLQDAQAMNNLQGVAGVSPETDTFGQVVYLGNNADARILGVTSNYLDVMNGAVADGSFISDAQVTAEEPVAVLGSQIAQELFNGAEPVGQIIRIKNQPFRVIGVMQSQGGTGFLNQDTQIFVPITAANTRLARGGNFRGADLVSNITVQMTSASQQNLVTSEITDVLDQRHHIQVQGQSDFTIQSQQDILNAASQVTGILTIFLGGVAAISLIVGGIGIMNIMLVSVTERTHEIGIRKAVGAHQRDILGQFLTEATILSVSGGVIGILFGMVIAHVISGIQVGSSTLTTVVAPSSVVLAVLFSVGVGLFFGIYPANRAATLNPIDALRYE
ncbi:MAG: ABC transporter permease [Chloroflexi bacterium]|nr:ABC transporter permease [Chloroflexota bacterium]